MEIKKLGGNVRNNGRRQEGKGEIYISRMGGEKDWAVERRYRDSIYRIDVGLSVQLYQLLQL